jgi:translation initiation factor IF-3
MSRRKHDGKTIQEKRKAEKDSVKFLPAAKPKDYVLRITYMKRFVREEKSVSVKAREQKRKLIEKRIKENRYWGLWSNGVLVEGPNFEEYEK